MWHVYSDAGIYGPLFLSILISLVGRTERVRACYYAITITIFLCFMHMLKLAYAAPRPFWSSDDVQAFSCSVEYGNPSGHTMIAVGLPLLIALDVVADFKESLSCRNRNLIYVAAVALGVSVGYSRLFLGVHSLNHVIYGGLLGAWIALTMHFVVKTALEAHLSDVLTLKDKRYSFLALVCLASFFLTYSAMILYTNSIEVNNLTEWSTRILAKCGREELEEAFATFSILSLGNACIGFFAYLGFVFSVYQVPDLASKNQNLSFSQRMSWLMVWLVSVIPVLLFQSDFDSSNYSLLAQMLLGEFTLYGYFIVMAFGVSEHISISLGLLTGSRRKDKQAFDIQ